MRRFKKSCSNLVPVANSKRKSINVYMNQPQRHNDIKIKSTNSNHSQENGRIS